jgi:hypothetical protein
VFTDSFFTGRFLRFFSTRFDVLLATICSERDATPEASRSGAGGSIAESARSVNENLS